MLPAVRPASRPPRRARIAEGNRSSIRAAPLANTRAPAGFPQRPFVVWEGLTQDAAARALVGVRRFGAHEARLGQLRSNTKDDPESPPHRPL